MSENLIPKIAELLGVEVGERFKIKNSDKEETVVLAMDGFHVIQPNDVLGPDHGELLSKVLQGLYEVKKIPWQPKEGEEFFYPNIVCGFVSSARWKNDLNFHIAMKALGMVYRTEQEAEEHFASDYTKLTGEPLNRE